MTLHLRFFKVISGISLLFDLFNYTVFIFFFGLLLLLAAVFSVVLAMSDDNGDGAEGWSEFDDDEVMDMVYYVKLPVHIRN